MAFLRLLFLLFAHTKVHEGHRRLREALWNALVTKLVHISHYLMPRDERNYRQIGLEEL